MVSPSLARRPRRARRRRDCRLAGAARRRRRRRAAAAAPRPSPQPEWRESRSTKKTSKRRISRCRLALTVLSHFTLPYLHARALARTRVYCTYEDRERDSSLDRTSLSSRTSSSVRRGPSSGRRCLRSGSGAPVGCGAPGWVRVRG